MNRFFALDFAFSPLFAAVQRFFEGLVPTKDEIFQMLKAVWLDVTYMDFAPRSKSLGNETFCETFRRDFCETLSETSCETCTSFGSNEVSEKFVLVVILWSLPQQPEEHELCRHNGLH